MSAGYSPLSLQSVFLAGLTLIYCTWLAPPNTLNLTSAIDDCNIMLYVMTERWPAGRKYRDVFERIKLTFGDLATQKKTTQGQSLETAAIESELRDRCKDLAQGFYGGGQDDFTQMFSEMTGERQRWDLNEVIATTSNEEKRQSIAAGEIRDQAEINPLRFPDIGPMKAWSYGSDALSSNGLQYYEGLISGWDLDMMDPTNLFKANVEFTGK